MRNFVKRLKKLELQKIGQRFQPMLQAADVSYEVQLFQTTLHCSSKAVTHIATLSVTTCA